MVWIVTLLLALLYFAIGNRYDIFRNELYFIACGRHPAFGYADLPPLVPWIAAATQAFGINVWLLRLPAMLAMLAVIPLTAEFARTLGGGKASAWMAAVAVALAPLLLATAMTLGTETFEPLGWTLCAYLLVRAIKRNEPRMAMWAGVVAGITFETKYGSAVWLIGLAAGVVLTRARKILTWPQLWYGVVAVVLIGAPSLVWQQLHGWPFRETIGYATEYRNLTGSPLRFEIGQIVSMGFLLAPLWIAGVVAPFLMEKVKPAQFISIAFIIATATIMFAHGKGYYLLAAYPSMFAVGAVACEGLARWLRAVWFWGAFALAIPIVPVVLPILPPSHLARYLDRTNLRPRPFEREGFGAPLTQLFSDELGWRQMEQQVAEVYRALPSNDRARAAILTSNYGEAAAIDVYGPADGLPPAICPQLQYYFWGTRGYDGSVILHVNGGPDRWKELCSESKVVGSFGGPYVMPYENGPIFICRGLRGPLPEIWRDLRRMH